MSTIKIVGVVTVAFFAKDRKPIVLALTEMRRLKPLRVIVVHDRKGASGAQALAAIEVVNGAFQKDGIPLDALAVDEDDTTPRWKRGIGEGFKDESVDAVFVFPSDFAKPPTKRMRAAWRDMAARATQNGLVLEDYAAAPGSFKDSFEQLVGIAAVEAFFPIEAAKIREMVIRQLRTEFFVGGRSVFERLDRDGIIWTLDPTIDLTLACLRSEDLELHVVELQGFVDDSSARENIINQLFQMTRFVSQLALNRARLERNVKRSPTEQIAAYDAIRACMIQGFDVLLRGMAQNRVAFAASTAAAKGAAKSKVGPLQ